jgi:NAD(P)H-dependent FMN reductase
MSDAPILILSGTNRPGSMTRRVAGVLEKHYGAAAEVYDLQDMPAVLFDPKSYAEKPDGWAAVQEKVVASAGLHVVTPEYNGGAPGVLKYFIDMLKFPESFEKKPVAFTGVAAGRWGGLRPVEQLSQIFAYRNAHQYPARVYLPGAGGLFDDSGKLTDLDADARLMTQCEGFAAFCKTIG